MGFEKWVFLILLFLCLQSMHNLYRPPFVTPLSPYLAQDKKLARITIGICKSNISSMCIHGCFQKCDNHSGITRNTAPNLIWNLCLGNQCWNLMISSAFCFRCSYISVFKFLTDENSKNNRIDIITPFFFKIVVSVPSVPSPRFSSRLWSQYH